MARIDFQKEDTYRNAYDGILRLTKHVSSVNELPEIGPSNGDIYSVGEDNSLYIYNGSWAPMGSGSSSDGGKFVTIHGNLADKISGRYFSEISEVLVAAQNGELSGGAILYGDQGKMSYSSISGVIYHAASGEGEVEYYEVIDVGGYLQDKVPTADALNLASSVSQRIYNSYGQYVDFSGSEVLCVILPYDYVGERAYQIWIYTSNDEENDYGLPVIVSDSTGYPILVTVDDNGVVTSVSVSQSAREGSKIVVITADEMNDLVGKRLIYSSSEINYED